MLFGPSRRRKGDSDGIGLTFRPELEDGTRTDPPTFRSAPAPGDTIPLGRDRELRVVDTRLAEGTDGEPVTVLVVEPT